MKRNDGEYEDPTTSQTTDYSTAPTDPVKHPVPGGPSDYLRKSFVKVRRAGEGRLMCRCMQPGSLLCSTWSCLHPQNHCFCWGYRMLTVHELKLCENPDNDNRTN